MKVKDCFIYIWFDKKKNKYYIGCHFKGHENDGYICSSNIMRKAYRRRPEDFKRRILQRLHCDLKTLLEQEEKWLKLAEKKKERYYNLHFTTAHWAAKENIPLKQKRSESAKKQWSSPEARKYLSDRGLKIWSNPEYRKFRKQIAEQQYSKLRITMSENNLQKGENNNQFGRIWITKGYKQNKKIKPEDLNFWEEQGYWKGRIGHFVATPETKLKMSIAAKNKARK